MAETAAGQRARGPGALPPGRGRSRRRARGGRSDHCRRRRPGRVWHGLSGAGGLLPEEPATPPRRSRTRAVQSTARRRIRWRTTLTRSCRRQPPTRPARSQSLRRAIELDPRLARAHRYLGILLGESGDSEGAASAFEAALAIEPNHARAWNNLGNAQRDARAPEPMPSNRSPARSRCSRTIRWRRPTWAKCSATRAKWCARKPPCARRLRASHGAGRGIARSSVLLAGLLRERGALDEALPLYQQAIELGADSNRAANGSTWAGCMCSAATSRPRARLYTQGAPPIAATCATCSGCI